MKLNLNLSYMNLSQVSRSDMLHSSNDNNHNSNNDALDVLNTSNILIMITIQPILLLLRLPLLLLLSLPNVEMSLKWHNAQTATEDSTAKWYDPTHPATLLVLLHLACTQNIHGSLFSLKAQEFFKMLTVNLLVPMVPHSGCAVFAGLFQLLANFCILLAGTYWAVQWSWFARVNALCNFSCKKSREVIASLPGQFLSRRCFMLCITMEVEPRIAKQYKCHHCCSCKNYRGEGMEGRKKVSLHRFFADQKIVISWKKCIPGHPIARATS